MGCGDDVLPLMSVGTRYTHAHPTCEAGVRVSVHFKSVPQSDPDTAKQHLRILNVQMCGAFKVGNALADCTLLIMC